MPGHYFVICCGDRSRGPLPLPAAPAISDIAIEESDEKPATPEDEVRFNATLIQLLKKDFDRDLSSFESDLPRDDSGVDVPLILEKMRREVRDIPGFEVVDESALGTFSLVVRRQVGNRNVGP